MNTNVVLSGFLLIVTIIFSSCKKSTNTLDLISGDSKISADINGNHWNSSSPVTYFSEAVEPVRFMMIGQSVMSLNIDTPE